MKNNIDFEKVKECLKKEFFGIDSQIDNICDIISVWYSDPSMYVAPCIVNLWGMTGVGKTRLINRIIEMLDEEHNKMYMNCHSMQDMDVYFMDSFIDDNYINNNEPKFIIFDDFQYIRTIDEDGHENNNSALSVMWNLLDTGIVTEKFYSNHYKIVDKIRKVFEGIDDKDAIKDGMFVNPHKYIPKSWFLNPDNSVFNVTEESLKRNPKSKDAVYSFMTPDTIDTISYLGRRVGMDCCEDIIDFSSARQKWDALEWKEFFNDLYSKMKKGNNKDFSNSIIFIIGNLDEAFYGFSKSVNPEMSADYIYNITSKINIVDIKKGLQKRFRNEQIARLGNTHIIYPSLNEDAYRHIIDKLLDEYSSHFDKSILFDSSIKDCIYNEGVFPTQGVRPLYSTINDIIKMNMPKAFNKMSKEEKDKAEKYLCSFDDESKSLIIKGLDINGSIVNEEDIKIPLTLRVKDAYKDDSESVANTSVHESGHFILYKYLTGKSPEKVLSKSLDSSCLGYMMEQFDEGVQSIDKLMNEIMVCLGGWAAERIVFGREHQSVGASQDIEDATSIAAKLLREFGMNEPILYSTVNDTGNEYTVLMTEKDRSESNDQIKLMMQTTSQMAVTLLMGNKVLRRCFKRSFTILNDKGELTEDDIKSISLEIEKADGYAPISETFYKDAIQSFEEDIDDEEEDAESLH